MICDTSHDMIRFWGYNGSIDLAWVLMETSLSKLYLSLDMKAVGTSQLGEDREENNGKHLSERFCL